MRSAQVLDGPRVENSAGRRSCNSAYGTTSLPDQPINEPVAGVLVSNVDEAVPFVFTLDFSEVRPDASTGPSDQPQWFPL